MPPTVVVVNSREMGNVYNVTTKHGNIGRINHILLHLFILLVKVNVYFPSFAVICYGSFINI